MTRSQVSRITKQERTRRSAQSWGTPTASDAATEELTLPSGFVVDVRRPPLTAWMMNGRVPERLLASAMGGDKAKAGQSLETMKDGEMLQMLKFVRDVVVATVISPRIVVGAAPDAEDEIDPSRIPEGDFYAVFNWAMSVPVKTADGGSLSAPALETFRS